LRASRPTKFSATAVGRYPPELEAAVYFCCLESLQNVARHAGADAEAEIRLWTANGDLCFAVEDDGIGVRTASVREGSGFANMDDRLAVFGGSLTVEARSPRGTTVRGSVPVTGSRRDV
jgi:signal transduction histidine kinase